MSMFCPLLRWQDAPALQGSLFWEEYVENVEPDLQFYSVWQELQYFFCFMEILFQFQCMLCHCAVCKFVLRGTLI